jgi:membrane-bound lytic murein transglycosylase MltF
VVATLWPLLVGCERASDGPASATAPRVSAAAPTSAPVAPPLPATSNVPPSAPPEPVIGGDGWLASQRGDLPEILERRVLRVLVVPNHTHYFVDGMVQRGFTAEAFESIAKGLNRKLNTPQRPLTVVFIPVPRDAVLTELAAGRGDVAAANLTVTPARRALVDFASPLYSDVTEIVVTAPDEPPLTRLEDLSGRTVHVRPATSYYQSLLAFNGRLARQGLPPVRIERLPDVLEDEDRLEMLNAGLIRIAIVDDHMARFWTQVFPQLRTYPDLALRTNGEVAWAVRKDAPQLRAALDRFVDQEFRKGTALRNQLHAKYLRSLKYVTGATQREEMQRFERAAVFFRRYAARYDVDWHLMAAQGYQESRLDQNVVSHVGAIGVMQVMPATGRELDVGDIRRIEANVHAGTKYVRRLIDEYFDDPGIGDEDRILFAFAGYNGGPNRINRLREEAARQGLDPNRWFGHVEVVVARQIGRETVQYVRNIYKYYVAYTLAAAQQATRDEAEKAASQPSPSSRRTPDSI